MFADGVVSTWEGALRPQAASVTLEFAFEVMVSRPIEDEISIPVICVDVNAQVACCKKSGRRWTAT